MHGGSLRSRRCGKLPHAISDSFEVNEMQRGNVIRRNVATRSAATQSHGRKEIRRVAHCAECRRSVHANTKCGLAQRKLTDHFFVVRVHTCAPCFFNSSRTVSLINSSQIIACSDEHSVPLSKHFPVRMSRTAFETSAVFSI